MSMTLENYLFLTFLILVFTIILLFVIWQAASTHRAKARLAREDEYRGLSARAVVALESAQKQLAEIAAEQAQTRARLDHIQRVLTVVE